MENWSTPDHVFRNLNKVFKFNIDVCAEKWNAKCHKFYSKEDNALEQDWFGSCWMNPPYNQLYKWMKKAYESARLGCTVVCLVPVRSDQDWWHEFALKGDIIFIRGRVNFIHKDGRTGRPRFASCIVVFDGISRNLQKSVEFITETDQMVC